MSGDLELRCPYCGRINDRHDEIDDPTAVPEPGAVCWCWRCENFAIVTELGTLRLLDVVEQAAIDADPRVIALRSAVFVAPTPAAILANLRNGHAR